MPTAGETHGAPRGRGSDIRNKNNRVIHLELFRENMTPAQVLAYPTLTLAHVGDCVYELLARSHVVHQGAFPAHETHRRTVALVSAEAQCRAARALLPLLEEDERAVFGRGRNAKPKTIPKHAGAEAYAYATGLEALFGYLYLLGRNGRIQKLWQAALAAGEEA